MVKYIAVDTETSGLDVYSPTTHVLLTSVWTDEGKGHVYKQPAYPGLDQGLSWWLSEESITKLYWNAKFDIRFLRKHGYKLAGPYIDVSLVARLLYTYEQQFTLKHFARKFLEVLYTEETELKKYIRAHKLDVKTHGYAEIPDRILFPYCLRDSQSTLELFFFCKERLKEHPGLKNILKREHKIQKISARMEGIGINLDPERCRRLLGKAEKRLAVIREDLCGRAHNPSFNPNSSRQVADLVYNGSVSPARFSDKTGLPSVDAVALLQSGSPVGALVTEWRQTSKAVSTYLKPFIRLTERNPTIHPSLNSSGTITGRFSSSGPNLQNIPRPKKSVMGMLRSCFVAREGFEFLFCDFDQIELRLAAHFAKEQSMLDAIHAGKDLHGETARRMFGVTPEDKTWEFHRYLAKTLNFSILYGTGSQKFCDTVLKQSSMFGEPIVLDVSEAYNYIARYKETHPGIMNLFTVIDTEVRQTGGVKNPYGRFIYVNEWKSYTGVNYLIQSTAAEVMKDALMNTWKFLKGKKSRLLLTVHDELIFEISHQERKIMPVLRELMENNTDFSVPLTCSASFGPNWGEKTKLS